MADVKGRYSCVWCGHPGPMGKHELYNHVVDVCPSSPVAPFRMLLEKSQNRVDELKKALDACEKKVPKTR